MLLLLAVAVAGHRFWLSPAWDPTQPFDFRARPTPVTRLKIMLLNRDEALCRAALTTAPLALHPAPVSGACPVPDAVRVTNGVVPTRPGSFLASCRLAVDWALFERDVVVPETRAFYGAAPQAVTHVGSYDCRDVRDRPGRLSAHARADAIDVSGIVLANGRNILVSAWHGPDSAFLHRLRDGACRFFGIVLSPDYNALHAAHLHLEASGWGMCR
ncbi:extensin-like domain-containing protein [Neoasaia chiangmaiensis]|uniref:extensin-like domain-containing protein n=1 Tax=Neoasaia chiangmaiensis TaxID=320497 RepID=UPI00147587E1|nr:extensin family protein [Neoasaia chiangmaiensis]